MRRDGGDFGCCSGVGAVQQREGCDSAGLGHCDGRFFCEYCVRDYCLGRRWRWRRTRNGERLRRVAARAPAVFPTGSPVRTAPNEVAGGPPRGADLSGEFAVLKLLVQLDAVLRCTWPSKRSKVRQRARGWIVGHISINWEEDREETRTRHFPDAKVPTYEACRVRGLGGRA